MRARLRRGRPTDIYALGACLFSFVYGRIPFSAPTVYQLFQARPSALSSLLAGHGMAPASPACPRDGCAALVQLLGSSRWSLVVPRNAQAAAAADWKKIDSD